MKPPREVRVGPYKVSIVYGLAAREQLDADDSGCFEETKQQIAIRDGLARDYERETVLHEVLHAVDEVTGLRQELGTDKEEDAVRRIAPTLLDTLRRNPRLVAYLLEADVKK